MVLHFLKLQSQHCSLRFPGHPRRDFNSANHYCYDDVNRRPHSLHLSESRYGPYEYQRRDQQPRWPFLGYIHKHDTSLYAVFQDFPTNLIKMSTTSTTTDTKTATVDHIVLYKVKEGTDPSKIDDMISKLYGLTSLGLVLSRTIGPIHRNDPSSATNFTHMNHSRFSSPEKLRTYCLHPAHDDVANEYVFPICDDVLVVDWVVDDLKGPLEPPPGSAMRVSLFKLKEDVETGAKDELLGAMKETASERSLDGVHQVTWGENISPLRAQGYSIASLVLYEGVSELETVGSNGEPMSLEWERLKHHLESAIVVDYAVASQ